MIGPCEHDLPTVWRGRKRAIPSKAWRKHYAATFGPIPEGCHVHHLCGDPSCSNLAHAQAVNPTDHDTIHGAGERTTVAGITTVWEASPV